MLNEEEYKAAGNEYLDNLKKKSRLQIYFGEHAYDTFVVLNDNVNTNVVGFIQELKIHVDAEKQNERSIEIVFPKFDSTYPIAKEIKEFVDRLKILSFVKVSFKELSEMTVEAKEPETESVTFASSDEAFQQSLNMVTAAEIPSVVRLKRVTKKEFDE